MKLTKNRLILEIIGREGGYVAHPDDRGGPTNHGITQQVAQANGYGGDMRHMPRTLAEKIYAVRYWDPLWLDEIVVIDESLASYLFDFAVNSGPRQAILIFQRLLNLFNRVERDYPDIIADGTVGPETLGSLQAYLSIRGREGIKMLASSLNSMRIAFLVELSEQRKSQEAFTYGWLRRVTELGVPRCV